MNRKIRILALATGLVLVLAALAFVLAWIVRKLVTTALGAAKFDERLGEAAAEAPDRQSVATSIGNAPLLNNAGCARYSGARTRAILVGVWNSVYAIGHATMLISSMSVRATTMSASLAPARSSTSG